MGIRYIGVKTKILDRILDKISSIAKPGDHVVDLMCGTASVSTALRLAGYRVTANDLMTFSFHHARVSLLFTSNPSFKGMTDVTQNQNTVQRSLFPESNYERVLNYLNNLPGQRGYFWREYCVEGSPKNTRHPRNYFLPQNAMRIDDIRWHIRNFRELGQIDDLEHSLLIHDLIMAANDVANIAGTYGHFLSKMTDRAGDRLVMKPSMIHLRNDVGWHHVYRGYAEDLAPLLSCDVCYIDPPYMKRQYAANYHILETIAREDEPEAIGVSGLRPWRDQYSNFCTKTKIRESFRKIFNEMRCNEFLVSYSEDGLLDIHELIDLCSEFGPVDYLKFMYKRFKSNDSYLAPELNEYLIHLKK